MNVSCIAGCAFGAVVAVGCVKSSTEVGFPQDRTIVALNNDCTQLAYSLEPEQLNREGIRTYFNDVSKGGLTHFIINPQGHNCAYETKVWDAVWRKDRRCPPVPPKRMFDHSRIFAEKGIDWVQELVSLCREQGVSPWISMRMNDIHGIGTGEAASTSRFWWDHPEYRRKAGKLKGWSEDSDLAFDYTHQAVRDRALLLVREMLENWDVDGFECDWLRFPHHVPDAAEKDRSGCGPLTAFMREVRKVVDEFGRRRGKRILVSVRVATTPEFAYGLGTDAVTWAREGLVDWVSPCNFWNTTDFLLPFAEWKAVLRAANPKVRLVGGLDFAGVARDGFCPQGLSEAEFCGYLERMYAAGVRDFESFNRFQYWERFCEVPSFRFFQVEGMRGGEAWLRGRDRAYPVVWHDAVPSGTPTGKALPVSVSAGGAFTVNVGRIGAAMSVSVLLAFDGPVPAGMHGRVSLNGTAATGFAEIDPKSWLPKFSKISTSCRVMFPLSAAKDGDNVISVAGAGGACKLHFVELFLGAKEES